MISLPRFGWVLLCATLAAGLPTPIPAAAQPASAANPIDLAVQAYHEGRVDNALHRLDIYLGEHPDDPRGLYTAGFIAADIGHDADAIPRLEHLTKLVPENFSTWELLAQLYQQTGAKDLRDNAIAHLHYIFLHTKDPAITSKRHFVREKLALNGRVYVALDTLLLTGDTPELFSFFPISETANPRHIITLHYDAALNAIWREVGALGGSERLLTLDRLELGPNGQIDKRETFAFYLSVPSYDAVRATVIDILSGKARPMSSGSGPTQSLPMPSAPAVLIEAPAVPH